jgi:pilus assembly protein CpaF
VDSLADAGDPQRARIIELQKEIHDRLLEYLDLRRMDIEQLADEELWEKTENAICDIVEGMDGEGAIPSYVNQDELIKDVVNEALGLGPLEDLLADTTISEILVNRAEQIFVERQGALELTSKGFSSDKALLGVIERLIYPLGQRINETSPLVDARLKDGSRINAIIPPLALKGPTLTIHKFRRETFSGEQLVQMETMSAPMLEFLQTAVASRKNIIFSGEAQSGKTSTLNALSNLIPENERIITVEEAAELQLIHQHWVQLESRPPNVEGKGEISIRDLLRNSLRMRPDRVLVGECRGSEIIEFLAALTTGHSGMMTTVHGKSPTDVLERLEAMVLMSGLDLPVKMIREKILAAFDLIVHQERLADNSCRITHITEIRGIEGETINLQDVFSFEQESGEQNGQSKGRFNPSGVVPHFYEVLQQRGESVNLAIFEK